MPVIEPSPDPTAFTILVVCTGNICRSAMAERLGRAFLADVLGERADEVRIISAGTSAVVDADMHPDSAHVLCGLGVGAGDFRARQLVGGMADAADLTLTMTRTHRHDVLQRDPRALARTFTLREAADLLRLLGDAPVDGATFVDRARDLVRRMAASRSHRRTGAGDDVRDPIGQPIEVHDEVATLIAESLRPILQRVADLHA